MTDDATALLVLGDEVRGQIAAKLGLGPDEIDDVPAAIEISLADVQGFAVNAVRVQVRSILTSSPAYNGLPPEQQKQLGHDMVRIL